MRSDSDIAPLRFGVLQHDLGGILIRIDAPLILAQARIQAQTQPQAMLYLRSFAHSCTHHIILRANLVPSLF